MCNTEWSIEGANVVCRQLGYDGAAAAPRNADFGQGRGAVWLDKVQCTGNESSLVECAYLGIGVNCRHWFDVGAACMPKGYNITIVFQDLKARRKKRDSSPKPSKTVAIV